MLAVEAVAESFWALAEHPKGHSLFRGENRQPVYMLSVPDSSLELEFSEQAISEALSEMGLNDDEWFPLPVGLYEVIVLSEE